MKQRRILFLDQNAWVALAQGAWDETAYPNHHAALAIVVKALKAGRIRVPLSFANIYETHKVNDLERRTHLARVQATLSDGYFFRSRRHIFERLLVRHLSARMGRDLTDPPADWFLTRLFFEGAADYAPTTFGFEISERVLDFIRQNPAGALFHYLVASDDDIRRAAVRSYSIGSADIVAGIEARRKLAAGESFAMRRRIYSARLLIDEMDVILATAKQLNPAWATVRDFGGPLTKSLVNDIPILHVERELAVRLEDQTRAVTENDLRDMQSFSVALPFADIMIAEKPFVSLARQAGLGRKYGTTLLTSITELEPSHLG